MKKSLARRITMRNLDPNDKGRSESRLLEETKAGGEW
jgi:hypothetical protein